MKIIYLGDTSHGATSVHRADALRRLGHDVLHLNPRAPIPRGRLWSSFSVRTGFEVWQPMISRFLKRAVSDVSYDIVWLDTGAEIGPTICRWLSRDGRAKLINYNHDDPFSNRDGRKWRQYLKAIGLFDLAVVVRTPNVQEAKAKGARKVVRITRPYDPVRHAPMCLSAEDLREWDSEVVFVGSWWPERGPFMLELLNLGVPLTIWGPGWENAPEFSRLKGALRCREVLDTEYVKAIQCSKIALGLLSKGNRDLHTQRSTEIPFIGTVLCAERTSEHEMLYEDGREVILWSSARECAERCKKLLAEPERRREIAASGRAKVIASKLSNDEVMAAILEEADL